jgi:hypothetical protein
MGVELWVNFFPSRIVELKITKPHLSEQNKCDSLSFYTWLIGFICTSTIASLDLKEFCCCCYCGSKDQTQAFVHAGQALNQALLSALGLCFELNG